MKLFDVLSYITNHPLNRQNKAAAVRRFIKWQLYGLIYPYPLIFPFTEKAKLIVKKGMTGATGNFYCGLHEFEDMAFLLHFLRPGDIFADVGANVGSYTVLACGHVGAKTISVEPEPNTYNVLRQNIALNLSGDRAVALNIGIGSKPGVLKFTKSLGTMNHVALDSDENTIDVPIDTLDHILKDRVPCLIKIDVEGYETEVINGAEELINNNALKAIIIELDSGSRYGLDESSVLDKFHANGFAKYRYDPKTRELLPGQKGNHNWLFIRDIEFVKQRVLNADKVTVNNCVF